METEQVESSSDLNLPPPVTTPILRELYFLIAKFLEGGPCSKASEVLIQELEKHEILPPTVNFLGDQRPQDFRTFSSRFTHITPTHLPKLLEQFILHSNNQISYASSSRSLLSYSTLNLINKTEVEVINKSGGKKGDAASPSSWCRKTSYQSLLKTRHCQNHQKFHPVRAIVDRAIIGNEVITSENAFLQPDFYERMGPACRTLGHLHAVYCVAFDVSGRYLITGADDGLVKVWSVLDGRLLYTFRRAASPIVDITVNYENTMLAVASGDKVVRIWSLRTGAPIASLGGQGGNSTGIFFCPMPRSKSCLRYLASTASDGSCAFWAYTEEDDEPVQFQTKPTLYLERMRPGNASMLSCSFSAGGLFMAAGSADNHVRVYHMLGAEGPERILEVEHHTDHVDSIAWAHEGLRFLSGSKDGTALIWRFENGCWRYIRLICTKTIGGEAPPMVYDDPRRRPRVTMVAWNADDSLVLTGVSDFMIRVWNSETGELLRLLKEHSGEPFVIEPHPTNPRVFMTAGHDGKLIIWDVGTRDRDKTNRRGGVKVYEYYNNLGQGQGHGCLFDGKWSPDGLSLATTDSHGHFILFSYEAENNPKYKRLPTEIFFHTDYRPLTLDGFTGLVLDEQTQVEPHLMPPPFLTDSEGNPYPPILQRLVPGRENLTEDSLIPIVAENERGHQEVIQPRSNIDEMILQLAREQGLEQRREQEREERREQHRRSGGEIIVEQPGVRQQSRANWQATNNDGTAKKKQIQIVQELNKYALEAAENKRFCIVEDEEKYYNDHLSRQPQSSPTGHSGSGHGHIGTQADTPEGRSRRVRRLALQAAERRQRHREEEEAFEMPEGVARPNPRPQMEISTTINLERRGERRRMIQPPPIRPRQNNRAGGAAGAAQVNNPNRRPRRVRYDVGRIIRANGSDIENLDLDSSSEEASVDSNASSSESSSSSDDDWGGNLGAGRRRREQENNNNNRNNKRRNSNSSNEEEDDNDKTNKKSTKVKAEPETSDEEMETNSEPKPGPSSQITKGKVKTEPETEPKPPPRPRKSKTKVDYTTSGLDEIPPQFRPSEWLADVTPHRSPYFPQLGDDLVYFRQGHEAYVKMVEEQKIYEIPKKAKKSLPYVVRPDLGPEVSVRVVGIKFEIEPPRVVILKLARTDWDTGELIRNGNDFLYVKYHDVPHVVDFLIMRQMYDKSIRRRWNDGDRFRCLIGREWWLGTIVKQEYYHSSYPQSNFLCYKVTWDSGEPETMSPWDIETIPDEFVIPEDCDGKEGIPAAEEDIRQSFYEPSSSDWPPHGHQDAQCQKLSTLLEHVMELAIAEAFLTPVDLNLYPDYATLIEYPMDLSTIKNRLDNRFYRRVDAVKFDISYIALNAEKYNKPGSDIVRHAKVVKELCGEILQNPDTPGSSVNQIYQRINKNAAAKNNNNNTTEARPSTSTSTSKAASTKSKSSKSETSSRRSSRRLHDTDDEDDDEEEEEKDWRIQCLELLNEIYHNRDAVPFREPVNIEEYPEYYQLIANPMDLGTVREELAGHNYHSIKEFHQDMMRVFSNSKQFNSERSQIYAMTCRLQSLYECRIQPVLKKRSGRRRRRSSGKKKSKKSTKNNKPSSVSSTPRKNPRRRAAAEGNTNRYLHPHSEESGEEEQENSRPRSREVRTRRGTYVNTRQSTSVFNGHGRRLGNDSPSRGMNGFNRRRALNNTTPQRNNNSSPRKPSTSTTDSPTRRPVKRLRISSEGESPQGSPSRRSPRNQHPSTRSSPRKPRVEVKREPQSGESSAPNDDDDEDEEEPIPNLDRNDHDYHTSDEYNSGTGEFRTSRRRSGRMRRSAHIDEHNYGTRNRGRPTRSYVEDQEEEEDEDTRYAKRMRRTLNSSSSPQRSSPRRRVTSDDDNEDDDDEEEDPNAPGPSSRLIRNVKKEKQEDHDDDDEEGSVEEEEGSDEDSDQDQDQEEDSEEEYPTRSSSRPQRKPLRQKQNISEDEDDDEDEERNDTRTRRRAKNKKSKYETSSPSRPRRRTNQRPDYNEEDSDSEPPTKITVSSRGRVRRTRSFLGD